MKHILLINITGAGNSDAITDITKILADYDVNVLDIGQALIHDCLSLGLLIQVPATLNISPVQEKLALYTHKRDIKIRIQPISNNRYQHWVSRQGRDRHIVTLLSRVITARQIAEVTAVARRYSLVVDNISRLSGRVDLENLDRSTQNKACVEFSVKGPVVDLRALHADFMKLTTPLNVDIAVQEDNIFRSNRRLVCFDMDSTLIEVEVIDELAKRAGVGEQVASITEKAMQGELDFKQSFAQRMALLKGLDVSVLGDIAQSLPIMEGAHHLTSTLRKLGYKTAILSGGFTYFGKFLQKTLGIDYVYANELEIVDNKLTGQVTGEVIDGQRKAELLTRLAKQEGVSLEQVIAVGDGANDLPMLSIAGLGIAFRAKPLVKASAKQAISNSGLDAILYLIGIRDWETT